MHRAKLLLEFDPRFSEALEIFRCPEVLPALLRTVGAERFEQFLTMVIVDEDCEFDPRSVGRRIS